MSLALLATSAQATDYAHVGYLSGAGFPYVDAIQTPKRVAVENATGRTFVADQAYDPLVTVFEPVGASSRYRHVTGFGADVLSAPYGIAIDQSDGSVYVSDAVEAKIFKFESDGEPTPTYTLDGDFTSPAQGAAAGEVGGFAAGLAVDAATGDLLVADPGNDRVSRYGSDGAFEDSFDGSSSPGGAFTGLVDLAVAPNGDVVVTDSSGDTLEDISLGATTRVERFDPAGTHVATIGPVEGGAGPLAVDPDSGEILVAGHMTSRLDTLPLRVHVFAADGTPVRDFPLASPPQPGGLIAGLAVKGGVSKRLYVNTNSLTGFGDSAKALAYGAIPGNPGVDVLPVADKGTNTARLLGEVNPFGRPTEYRFEYGTDTGYGSTTAVASAGSGRAFKAVARPISGLAPGTTYHYRLVAESSSGTTVSPDATFETPSRPLPARAYEMVSPADKNSSDVSYRTSRSRGSLSGDVATFISTGNFAGSQGGGKVAQYLSERDPRDGWRTRAVMPIIKTYGATLGFAPIYRDFTPTLDRGVIITADPQPVASAPSGTWNLYVRDNVANEWSLVTTVAPAGADMNYRPRYAGASTTFDRVVFESNGALTPDAPDDGLSKIYEWHDGALRLASVLDDGSPVAGGAVSGAGADHGDSQGATTRRTVSADGSRIVFTGTPSGDLANAQAGQLYVRIDGERTHHVNASERTTPDTAAPALFGTASVDGKRVLFTTTEQLVDADTDDSSDVYMYVDSDDPEADANLTLVSADDESRDGTAARALGIIGASDDGSRVYFAAENALVPAAFDGFEGGYRLYQWHDGEIDYIGPATSDDSASGYQDLWQTTYSMRAGRVSSDGRSLLYTSYRESKRVNGNYGFFGGLSYRDVYVYSADTGRSRCVSCNPYGYQPPLALPLAAGASLVLKGSAVFAGDSAGIAATGVDYENRALSSDGSRAFFSTDQPLLADDTNGRIDAYEYDVENDQLRLLSTGKSADDSYFIDASADGRDVFFVTRERLVGWDRDNNVDLYDARVGGGFAEPPAGRPECSGDACQGQQAGPADGASLGSRTTRGRGDVESVARAGFTVVRPSKATLTRLLRGRRATIGVRVSRPGRVRVLVQARVGRRKVTVAAATRRARAAGLVRVQLKARAAVRRKLAGRKTVRLDVSARFGGSDVVRRQARTLRLTRGAGK